MVSSVPRPFTSMLPPSSTTRDGLPSDFNFRLPDSAFADARPISAETGASRFQSLYLAQALNRHAVAAQTKPLADLPRASRLTKIGPVSRSQPRFVGSVPEA